MNPNILVICIDSLRADCVGPGKRLGHVRTPNIDRLAAESVSFDRCFSEGLPTIQVRRCLFTGRRSYPFRQVVPCEGLQPQGPGWHPIAHDEPTLSERLHDAGYLTGFISDTYHMFKPAMNFTRGFISWQFIRGQENDPFRSGPFERINLAAHVPDGEASPAKHPTVAQYLLNALDRRGEEDWQCAQVFRAAARWLED
ncbi:MAG: sulfatase, partial [Planctomycetes bacterium]|nr:sulfatase [Planctomycetota bacterium]